MILLVEDQPLLAMLTRSALEEAGHEVLLATNGEQAMARAIDRVEQGDLVAFRTAGAYGAAMSSGYNSRPLTPEVLVNGDKWALVRRRIDIAEASATPLPNWLR